LKEVNCINIHDFNDASANGKTVAKSKRKNPKSQSFQGFSGMVRMTGFPPVAALPTNSPPDCLVLLFASLSRTNCYRNFLPTKSRQEKAKTPPE
jgi:hypothetical protein